MGLEERIICIESLSAATSDIRKLKCVFLKELGPHNQQTIDTFYSRTIDATGNLRPIVASSCPA